MTVATAGLMAAAGGALIVAGLLGLVAGLRRVPVATPAPPRRLRRPRLTGAPLLLLLGLAVGALLALLTGWLVAVVVVPAAVVGVPALVATPDSARRIARLEAMEEWVRSLSGVLTVGMGLEQALVTSLRSTPPPIRAEVGTLVARLNARMPTETALRAFAADLDDATGDLLVGYLILGARRRGGLGLPSVLDSLAESLAADVRARREIEADRGKPRSTARLVTLISLALLVSLALTGSHVRPYGTPLGQLVLAVLLAAYAATLAWMRRMSAMPPLPRFLGNSSADRPGRRPAGSGTAPPAVRSPAVRVGGSS